MTLQGEDWNVCRNDDEHREQRRTTDFVGSVGNHGATLVGGQASFLLRQALQYIFYDDHSAVNDDAEIHRTQRQQISRYAHDFET